MARFAFSESPAESFQDWVERESECDDLLESECFYEAFDQSFFGKPFFMRPITLDFDVHLAAAESCPAESVLVMTAEAILRKADAF